MDNNITSPGNPTHSIVTSEVAVPLGSNGDLGLVRLCLLLL